MWLAIGLSVEVTRYGSDNDLRRDRGADVLVVARKKKPPEEAGRRQTNAARDQRSFTCTESIADGGRKQAGTKNVHWTPVDAGPGEQRHGPIYIR